MRKRSLIVPILVACAFVALLAAGSFVTNANTIDDVAWKGDPVPPCFVNAALCGGHLLGTDEVGRDLAARLVTGARVTLGISFLAALLTLAFAAILAALARFGGPVVRFVVMRLGVGVSSMPAWLFLVALVDVGAHVRSHAGLSWAMLVVVTAAIFWPKMTSLLGSTHSPMPVIDRFFRDWASIVLVLATIEFFGYGTMPPTASWGNMLASMEATLQTGWWVGVFPGLCIFATVFALRAVARYAFSESVEAE